MGSQALVVQHDHTCPPGHVGARLRARGYVLDELLVVPRERHHSPGVPATFPNPREFDLIVLLGAEWSVYDSAAIGSWLNGELAMIREAQAAVVPVLGICFGGQALAAALGGSVERAPRPEIGWMRVQSDVPDLVHPGPWFQFHHDRWRLPPGATEVARTSVCSQAFTIGRSLGVQFHPEVDAAILDRWLADGGEEEARNAGVDVNALRARTRELGQEAAGRAHRLVDLFLERVASVEARSGARRAS